jgi:hypothetical protein
MHGLSYLEDGLLRFSPLAEFNDPFEMRPYLDSLGTPEQVDAVFRQVGEEYPPMYNLSPAQINEVRHHVQTRGLATFRSEMVASFESVGILCLVDNRHDDLLMWAHYADSHKGCVLEFDSTHEWFRSKHGNNPHPFLGVLQTVEYKPSRPQVSLLALDRNHLLTKAECWSYEREMRMVMNLQDCSTETRGDREVMGLFPVPREAVTNVYLGEAMEIEVRDQFLRALPPGHPVGLFQFRLHEQEYALIARQIN